MKTVYIPKGETVRYDRLYADRIVVDGCLEIDHSLDAKVIAGKGIIHAGKVSADTIRIGYLDACQIVCKRLLASRVDSPEVTASESIVVSCVLSACMVKTRKLTVAICEVEDLQAEEVEKVPAKRWSVFGILLFTTLQALWYHLRAFMARGEAIDADYEPVKDTGTPKTAAEEPAPASTAEAKPTRPPVDEELNRVINLFHLSRASGYTLRIIPGTPEENAPKFDVTTGKIIRPAA